MKLSVSEILENVSKLKRQEDKINELRKNSCPALHTMLQGAYDPRVKWLLPEGVPPFNENTLVDSENILHSEHRKLYLFVKGGNDNLKPLRREQLFVEMLERLHPKDAKLLISIKDKVLPYPSITYEIVNLAFPGLLP